MTERANPVQIWGAGGPNGAENPSVSEPLHSDKQTL